jgi:hypothetical protein
MEGPARYYIRSGGLDWMDEDEEKETIIIFVSYEVRYRVGHFDSYRSLVRSSDSAHVRSLTKILVSFFYSVRSRSLPKKFSFARSLLFFEYFIPFAPVLYRKIFRSLVRSCFLSIYFKKFMKRLRNVHKTFTKRS